MGSLSPKHRSTPKQQPTVIIREPVPEILAPHPIAEPEPTPVPDTGAPNEDNSNTDTSDTDTKNRVSTFLARNRGRTSTIRTGFRGVLNQANSGLQRKTLLGE